MRIGSDNHDRTFPKDNREEVVIPDGTERIGGPYEWYEKHIAGAFAYCKNLNKVSIPASVKSIGHFAFYKSGIWENQKTYSHTIYADKWVVALNSIYKGILELKNDTIGIADHAFAEVKKLKEVIIPNGLKYIGVGVFYRCDNLKSISIPESVVSIAQGYPDVHSYTVPNAGLFYKCNKLESINIDGNNRVYKEDGNCIIRKSGNALIAGCKNSIIPEYVKTIKGFSFWGCDIENIKISKNVIEIEENAFFECGNLTSITVEEGNPVYYSENNCLIRKKDKTLLLCCKEAKIPDYIDEIKRSAVSCVETLVIPKSMKFIKRGEFNNNRNLKHLVIPQGVTAVDTRAFSFCTGLRTVIIPESVVEVGWLAFGETRNLNIYVYGHKKKPEGWDNGWKTQSKKVTVYWDYSNEATGSL